MKRTRLAIASLACALLFGPAWLMGSGCGERYSSSVTVDFQSNQRVVPPFLFGQNLQTIENGEQVIAADGGLDDEIVAMLTEARITTLRFPGGTQADHFIWWQAVGPPSRRALQGSGNLDELYKPVIGPEEFIDLAKALRAVPFITANTGSGSAALAGAWAHYFKSVGFPAVFWEIGNEPYFDGINAAGVVGLTPDAYAAKVIEYATAIRAEVPNAQIFVAGLIGPADDQSYWNAIVLGLAGPYIDGMSLHNAYAPLYGYTPGPNPVVPRDDELYLAMMGATKSFERSLGVVRDELARNGRTVPIFITEYDGVFFPDKAIEDPVKTVARNSTLDCALYNASILQVMMRNDRVFGAHHMSLAGSGRGSLVGVEGGVRFRNPHFYVHQEYAKEADHIVVKTALDPETAVFNSIAVRETPAQTAVPMLDVVATRDPAGKQFALFVVNRHLFISVDTTLTTNLPAGATGTRTQLTGPNHDSRNDAANPNLVVPQTTSWSGDASFSAQFPPHSLTIYRWTLP